VRRAVIVLTVLLALLGAAGCSGSAGSRSNRTQCLNGVCQVSLSGEQTIELEIARSSATCGWVRSSRTA
jgi:hypothetical protein